MIKLFQQIKIFCKSKNCSHTNYIKILIKYVKSKVSNITHNSI